LDISSHRLFVVAKISPNDFVANVNPSDFVGFLGHLYSQNPALVQDW
jgi:hypothetical protein